MKLISSRLKMSHKLWSTGGVELKDNAAYSSAQTQPVAHSQFIGMEDDAAYGIAMTNHDYDVPINA